MIHKSSSRIAIPSNGHALVNPIRMNINNIIQFIAHTPRPRHIRHTSRPVQLGPDDIIHHTARISDPETAGFDPAHGRGPDHDDALVLGLLVQGAGHVLGDALGDDGDGPELLEGHGLHGDVIGRPEGGEVDQDVDFRVFFTCFL